MCVLLSKPCFRARVILPVGRVSRRLCIQVEAKHQVKLRANTVSSQLKSRRLSRLAEQLAVNSTVNLPATGHMCSVRPGTTEG